MTRNRLAEHHKRSDSVIMPSNTWSPSFPPVITQQPSVVIAAHNAPSPGDYTLQPAPVWYYQYNSPSEKGIPIRNNRTIKMHYLEGSSADGRPLSGRASHASEMCNRRAITGTSRSAQDDSQQNQELLR